MLMWLIGISVKHLSLDFVLNALTNKADTNYINTLVLLLVPQNPPITELQTD